jgi:hypothetical protein
MPKRLHDPTRWKEARWFRRLSGDHKLAFQFIEDNCDWCGVWPIDMNDLHEYTGKDTIVFDEFLEEVNKDFDKFTGKLFIPKRLIHKTELNAIWYPGYINLQMEDKKKEVNPTGKHVISALTSLNNYGLLRECLVDNHIKFPSPYDPLIQKWLGGNYNDNEILVLLTTSRVNLEGKRVQGRKGDKKNQLGVDVVTEDFLIGQMTASWMQCFPGYQYDEEIDSKALLKIAYKICDLKKWNYDEIINGRFDDGIKTWRAFAMFCKDHKWYSSRSLQDLSNDNEWKRFVQTINSSKGPKDESGGYGTGVPPEIEESAFEDMDK